MIHGLMPSRKKKQMKIYRQHENAMQKLWWWFSLYVGSVWSRPMTV